MLSYLCIVLVCSVQDAGGTLDTYGTEHFLLAHLLKSVDTEAICHLQKRITNTNTAINTIRIRIIISIIANTRSVITSIISIIIISNVINTSTISISIIIITSISSISIIIITISLHHHQYVLRPAASYQASPVQPSTI